MHYSLAIPYRNRAQNLGALLAHLVEWLPAQSYMDSYDVTVVEQADDKLFNLGWCINVGFDQASRRAKPFRFVFQPADCLPLSAPRPTQGTPNEVRSEVPESAWSTAHFASYYCPPATAVLLQPEWWQGYWTKFGTYYKALVFDPVTYFAINGHPNGYFGWGREDDELLHRLQLHGVTVECRASVFDELTPGNGAPRQSPPDPEPWRPEHHSDEDGLSDLQYKLLQTGRLQVGPLRVDWIKVTR